MDRINDEMIMQVLQHYNIWWFAPNALGDMKHAGSRNAFYEAVNKLSQEKKFIFISGQRRVGKTVVMYELIQHLIKQGVPEHSILYIPFHHTLFRMFEPKVFLRVYRDYIDSRDNGYFFFDDVQRAPAFGEWLIAADMKRTGTHIIASSTIKPAALLNSETEMAVQREDIYIPPLSFYEYCTLFAGNDKVALPPKLLPQDFIQMSNQEQNKLHNTLAPLRKHFAKYLHTGGYPGMCGRTETVQDLRTAMNHTLYQDIATVFKTRNVTDLEKLLLFLCFQTSPIASYDVISNAIDTLSRPTIEKYVKMLESVGLVSLSSQMSIDGELLQKSLPKIYVIDGALKNALTVMERHNITAMNYSAEAVVFRQIEHMTMSRGASIGYYRTNGPKKKAIDIVVKEPKGKVFIDIRYLDDYEFSHSEPIWAYLNESKHAFVITKQEDDFGPFPNGPEKLYRMPAHTYLYLLGNAEREKIIGKR